MARRVRVTGSDGEWIAELGASGVTLSSTNQEAGAFVVTDEGAGHFAIDGPPAARHGVAVASGGDTAWVSIDGHVFEFQVTQDADRAPRPAARDQDALSPPMSATVVRVAVRPGDVVQAGDTLVLLEAMKMELSIRAPRAGTVRAIHCREGDLVQPGTVVVDLE